MKTHVMAKSWFFTPVRNQERNWEAQGPVLALGSSIIHLGERTWLQIGSTRFQTQAVWLGFPSCLANWPENNTTKILRNIETPIITQKESTVYLLKQKPRATLRGSHRDGAIDYEYTNEHLPCAKHSSEHSGDVSHILPEDLQKKVGEKRHRLVDK